MGEVEVGMFGQVRALASVIAERAGLAKLASITFGGKRDLFEALGYTANLSPRDYYGRYERNSVATRVVEALPRETWRSGAELVEDENPDVETAFETAWGELAERLQLWSVFKRADILAGLGRYAVILIGAPGELKLPLPGALQPEQIAYLTPFPEDDADIVELERDTASPRFGMPSFYAIKRLAPSPSNVKTTSSTRTRVHASRVLHIADGLLSDNVYGRPRLQAVWNDLDNLEKVVGGGSEAFWLRVHQGYHVNFKPEVKIDQPDIDKVREQAEEFAHGMRRTLGTKGADIEVFGSDVSNFSNQLDALLTLISVGTGIPKRILMGSERGELASSQDRSNWNDRITDRRTDYAEPQVVRPFVQMCVDRGALPKPKAGYTVRWPEIQFLSEDEQATVATKWAQLNGTAGEVVVSGAEIRDRVLGLGKLNADPSKPNKQPDPALSKAQVETTLLVVKALNAGDLEYDGAVATLVAFLGVDEKTAKLLLGTQDTPEEIAAKNAPPAAPGAVPPDPNAPAPAAPAAPAPTGGARAAAAEPTYALSLDLPEDFLTTLSAPPPKKTVVTKKVVRDENRNVSEVIETHEEQE